jgi:hypothetical protein
MQSNLTVAILTIIAYPKVYGQQRLFEFRLFLHKSANLGIAHMTFCRIFFNIALTTENLYTLDCRLHGDIG